MNRMRPEVTCAGFVLIGVGATSAIWLLIVPFMSVVKLPLLLACAAIVGVGMAMVLAGEGR